MDDIFAAVHAQSPPGVTLEIPPKVFRDMHGELIDYVRNVSLRASFPAFERYAGPTGMVQGGIISAMFDNSFGPFSYLVAKKPCATITLDVHFMRPAPVDGERLTVDVYLRTKSRTVLFMDGEMTNQRGKTVARATTTLAILRPPTREGESKG